MTFQLGMLETPNYPSRLNLNVKSVKQSQCFPESIHVSLSDPTEA